MKKIKANLIEKTKNVLDEEIKVCVGTYPRHTHAWEEKDNTADCWDCPRAIERQSAKNIIKMVKEKRQNGWLPPLESRILGVCMLGRGPKILVPPRTSLKKCRYF